MKSLTGILPHILRINYAMQAKPIAEKQNTFCEEKKVYSDLGFKRRNKKTNLVKIDNKNANVH